MKSSEFHWIRKSWLLTIFALVTTLLAPSAFAAALPGGTLDPLTIPKYVQPLVIPPVMPTAINQPVVLDAAGNPVAVPAANYNIAVRQFRQQILPGGVWNTVNGRTDAFNPTPVWSYGSAEDAVAHDAAGNPTYVAPAPLGTPGATFNYPAFTLEEVSGVQSSVRWINDLKNPVTGNYLPHLLTGTVDQTLHWANPTNADCTNTAQTPQTDCATLNPAPYTGPVPIVTHVHGAHVNQESDGYPEAWWLADANNIPAGYKKTGTLYTQRNGLTNVQGAGDPADFDPVGGAAFYTYENTQPATTLWYHDHSLGITRLNVYAGTAGFYLVRGGVNDGALDIQTNLPAVLPGPAPAGAADPNFNAAYRSTIREIPIVVQDRSFNADGSLFYPNNRTFFDGFTGPYIGGNSDIPPIWNPEAFFNTMVVNGTTWPQLAVAPANYRFRLLNGSNSRFLNLSMFTVDPLTGMTTPVELPFYQIGGDQGFLPDVVEVMTGFMTPINPVKAANIATRLDAREMAIMSRISALQAKLAISTRPAQIASLTARIAGQQAKLVRMRATKIANITKRKMPAPDPMQALLMAPAERMDVIVDFSSLAPGTIVRMINTAPDAPFGGFPDIPADPATSGQVMQFVVSQPALASDALTTSPQLLQLNAEAYNPAAPNALTGAATTVVAAPRQLSLNEEESAQVCVTVDATGALVTTQTFPTFNPNIIADCATPADPTIPAGVPQAPREALLGLIAPDPTQVGSPLVGVPQLWKDPLTENPALDSTEFWDFYNMTVDGHPIHMHLVRYKIIQRQLFDPLSPTLAPLGRASLPLANEAGMKDTVLAYPGEITRIQATFNLAGLYVWHCHILEHEDNEMMRPFYVGVRPAGFPVP